MVKHIMQHLTIHCYRRISNPDWVMVTKRWWYFKWYAITRYIDAMEAPDL